MLLAYAEVQATVAEIEKMKIDNIISSDLGGEIIYDGRSFQCLAEHMRTVASLAGDGIELSRYLQNRVRQV